MYERLLGIRQPQGSYGFEAVELAPPLVESIPSMAGRILTVRGEVALAWAWRGEPMRSALALNCTVPPNIRTTVAIPVPGLAKLTITEDGAVVWRDGAFVSGVAGVTGGSAGNDSTIVLDIGSGNYSFLTASGDDGRSDALAVQGCDTRVRCPAGTIVARIVRAGLVDVNSGGPLSLAAPLRSRYLLTHVLEQQCLGQDICDLKAAQAARVVAPAVTLQLGSGQLCAEVVCE
jgi:hypothetical protein